MGRIGRLNGRTFQSVNLDSIKELFSNLNARDLPSGAAALIGLVLLFLVFKTGKFFMKLTFLIITVGLFAAASWWHTNH